MSARLMTILIYGSCVLGCERSIPNEPPSSSNEAATKGANPDSGRGRSEPTEPAVPTGIAEMPQVTDKAVADDGDGMLSHFVGVWQTRGTNKPSRWQPEGNESTVHEVTQWALKNQIILGREHDQTDGRKALWVMTYDQQQNAYPFWMFDSNGLMGGRWQLTWDASTQTATGHATDTPAGWTSHGTNQFRDATANNVHFWMKDETGALLMEANATKRRQSDEAGVAWLAAWSKSDPIDAQPAELKVLDRMIGTWDTVTVQKPAEWTPDGGQSTATVTREWILNGRFLMDTSLHSNGDESIAIFGFDPGQRTYRSWWFNSLGNRSDSRGQWNEVTQTLSWQADLEEGRRMRSSVRFADANKEVWQLKVTDADGTVYLDMDIAATRRAAAAESDVSNVKQTDRERLQGTWGLVSIVQDGMAADEEPIAPEDSAIKYVFQGDRFTLLASGNAGDTPQGTLKLETRGNARTIEFAFPPDPGSTQGQSILGVYKLEADTLTICNVLPGAKLPVDFESAVASNRGMTVYQRIREKR